jgi:hypothetical protein
MPEREGEGGERISDCARVSLLLMYKNRNRNKTRQVQKVVE